ncbi:hypothetical protein [Vitiosangium sp. GDMCC 1.1324]|uniref:hypothetical protein n=1 Tax=Vitiosangium sp. (strain GDMCC 1.1324) TaxID=2138576 RepID=UPI000D3BA350|nr:hypothetical protein [Vitiosangium sp. GDMCC 1.1324]PTL77126.1 hypothetical protein DAT35_46675 [Vitiosangium sp. GDMCC 1.1324]
MRALVFSLVFSGALLLAPVAAAEAPVLTARGRVDASHLSLLAGPQGVGLGFLLARPPVPDSRPIAAGGELFFHPSSGVLELRGSGQWQLSSGERAFSASAQLGLTAYGVVRGPADAGLGPHAGLTLGLGGPRLEGFLGAQAGLETFLRTGGPRFPLRALLGGHGRLGPWGLTLTARAGVDLEHGLHATWRGDVLLALSWYGRVPNPEVTTEASAPPRP